MNRGTPRLSPQTPDRPRPHHDRLGDLRDAIDTAQRTGDADDLQTVARRAAVVALLVESDRRTLLLAAMADAVGELDERTLLSIEAAIAGALGARWEAAR